LEELKCKLGKITENPQLLLETFEFQPMNFLKDFCRISTQESSLKS
jgi:hypothetical protein